MFLCSQVDGICLPKCPLECVRKGLDYLTSSYKYPPSTAYANRLKAATSFKLAPQLANFTDYRIYFAQNIVQLSVSLDSLWHHQVVEKPLMNLEELIGHIGAHLFVFLGMSLASFYEIVSLLAHVAFWLGSSATHKQSK
jgi:hypothetical protein